MGSGPYGYQFRTRPGGRYRLYVENHPIPGVPDKGILMDVADRGGYTHFVRMPKPIPIHNWILLEVFGEADIARDDCYGRFALILDESNGEPLPGRAYAIEVKDGPIVCGTSDANGRTCYVVAQGERKIEISVMTEDDCAEQRAVDALAFRAECFAKRERGFEENLARLEGLFGAANRLRRRLPHSSRERCVADAREDARRLPCLLRAWRAAFLLRHKRKDLAKADLAHLALCPRVNASFEKPLEALQTQGGDEECPPSLLERMKPAK